MKSGKASSLVPLSTWRSRCLSSSSETSGSMLFVRYVNQTGCRLLPHTQHLPCMHHAICMCHGGSCFTAICYVQMMQGNEQEGSCEIPCKESIAARPALPMQVCYCHKRQLCCCIVYRHIWAAFSGSLFAKMAGLIYAIPHSSNSFLLICLLQYQLRAASYMTAHTTSLRVRTA